MPTTRRIMNTLKGANIDSTEANYYIQSALEALVDAVDLARKNGDVQLIGACEVAEVKMQEAAHALQLARNDIRATISQLDGFNPKETA